MTYTARIVHDGKVHYKAGRALIEAENFKHAIAICMNQHKQMVNTTSGRE